MENVRWVFRAFLYLYHPLIARKNIASSRFKYSLLSFDLDVSNTQIPHAVGFPEKAVLCSMPSLLQPNDLIQEQHDEVLCFKVE